MPNGGSLDPFRFDQTWVFAVPPAEFWRTIHQTHAFRQWWPWLRAMTGPGLVPGGRTECEIRAPIPYSLRFVVEVTEIVPERVLDAIVTGDLAGPARLETNPDPAGTRVRLNWEMDLNRPLLRRAARFGRPVMEWGHQWVVNTGVDQFVNRALRVGRGSGSFPPGGTESTDSPL